VLLFKAAPMTTIPWRRGHLVIWLGMVNSGQTFSMPPPKMGLAADGRNEEETDLGMRHLRSAEIIESADQTS
jgi:hypothetical protein